MSAMRRRPLSANRDTALSRLNVVNPDAGDAAGVGILRALHPGRVANHGGQFRQAGSAFMVIMPSTICRRAAAGPRSSGPDPTRLHSRMR